MESVLKVTMNLLMPFLKSSYKLFGPGLVLV